ncbi:hypothetical protein EON66_02940 [archaeon]|nr:MAG: hypothetical protein EON66_02940 [archaeon]
MVQDLEAFKQLNEAYKVLSNPTLRQQYDTETYSKEAMLKRRNEGGGMTGDDMGASMCARCAVWTGRALGVE